MNENLKELIDKAQSVNYGVFNEFLIIPSGRKYDGFWGVNGYNHIIVLAKKFEEKEWLKLTDSSDVISFLHSTSVNIDIPTEYNCVRVFFNNPITINDVNSSIIGFGD